MTCGTEMTYLESSCVHAFEILSKGQAFLGSMQAQCCIKKPLICSNMKRVSLFHGATRLKGCFRSFSVKPCTGGNIDQFQITELSKSMSMHTCSSFAPSLGITYASYRIFLQLIPERGHIYALGSSFPRLPGWLVVSYFL